MWWLWLLLIGWGVLASIGLGLFFYLAKHAPEGDDDGNLY